MKNAIQNPNRKINHVQLWLFLSLFTTTFFPLGVRGQAQPPPPIQLSGFDCFFSNQDGPFAYPCASVITAKINIPVQSGTNQIQTVRLVFPNSFEITGVTNCNQSTTSPSACGSTVVNSTAVAAGQLYSQTFQPTGSSGTMEVAFSYRTCHMYSAIPLFGNSNQLYFDCDGWTGVNSGGTQYLAKILNPIIVGSPGLTDLISQEIAQANITTPPAIGAINLVVSTATQLNQTHYAPKNTTYYRYFTVQINSHSITRFNLHIGNEVDVEELELVFCDNANNPTVFSAPLNNTSGAISIPANPAFGEFIISFGATGSNFNLTNGFLLPTTGYPKTVSFRQKVKLGCDDPNWSNVNVNLDCGLNCIVAPVSNSIILNGIAPIVTNIQPSLCTLENSAPNGISEPCDGTYFYTLGFSYNDPITPSAILQPTMLNKIIIPINTLWFTVESIEIGDASSFSNPMTLSTNPTNLFLTPTGAIGSGNHTLTINVDGLINTYPPPSYPWPGIDYTYNPGHVLPPYNYDEGAWINTIANLSTTDLRVRIKLVSNAPNPPTCPSAATRLTPPTGNIEFNLSNTCAATQTYTRTPFAVATPPAPSAQIVQFSPDPNVNIGGAPLDFICDMSIPTQSPFQLKATSPTSSAVTTTLINCVTTIYRGEISFSSSPYAAVLGSPINCFVAINGGSPIPINIIANTSTTLTFDLPNVPLMGQTFNNFHLTFSLTGIGCPDLWPPGLGQGEFNYDLTLFAICGDCGINSPPPSEIRYLDCEAAAPVAAHCSGPCTSKVDTDPDIIINRNTFGWKDPIDFPSGNATAIQTAADFIAFCQTQVTPPLPAADIDEQLRNVYPYDKFSIQVNGNIKPIGVPGQSHTDLSFEINYPTGSLLAPEFFEFVSCTTIFIPAVNHVPIGLSNPPITASFQPDFSLPPVGQHTPSPITTPQFWRDLQWSDNNLLSNSSGSININAQEYNIELTAYFRIKDNLLPGVYHPTMQCLFRSLVAGDPTRDEYRTCDIVGDHLNVLIPGVEIIENTVQAGDISLPQLAPNTVVGNANNPESLCDYIHAVGIRHWGGNGNFPDFYPEYRPITEWPNQITGISLSSLDDFYNGPIIYSPPTFMNGSNTLLPTLVRGGMTPNNYQGLILTKAKDCTNLSPAVDLSNLLSINRYAYIHAGFDISTPAPITPSAPNTPTNPLPVNPLPDLDCSSSSSTTFFPGPVAPSTTISLPNGTSSNPAFYDFILNMPASSQDVPVALKITVNTGIANVSFDNLMQEISGTYTALTQVGNFGSNLYYFNSGTGSSGINLRLPIILGGSIAGCYNTPFTITFEWSVYCGITSITNTSTACWTCSTTRDFKRSATSLNNAVIDNQFALTGSGCELEWTLNITNPGSQPDILLDALLLKFSTGLIYQSATWEVSNSGNGQISFTNAAGSISPAPNFTYNPPGNPSFGSVQCNFLINPLLQPPPVFTLPSGETLTYRIIFKLSQEFCTGTYTPGGLIITNANFVAINACSEITIPFVPIDVNIALPDVSSMIGAISTGPGCCEAPPMVIVKHTCGTSPNNGEITVENPSPGTINVKATLYYPAPCSLAVCSEIAYLSSNIIPPITPTFTNLGAGTYHLVVWDPNTGSYTQQDVVIEDYSFATNPSISPDPAVMCSGSPINLLSNAAMNVTPSGAVTYNYEWFLDGISMVSGPTPDYNALIGGNYSVTVSNGSCSTNASITVLENPPVEITGNSTSCGAGTSQYSLPNYFPANDVLGWTLDGQPIPDPANPIANPNSANLLSVTIDWSLNNYFGGTLVATTNAVCGSTGTVTFNVWPCCSAFNNLNVNNLTDIYSNIPALPAGTISNPGSTYIITGATFVLDNASGAYLPTLNCDANLVLINCNIAMENRNRFLLEPGRNITLINTNIKSCYYRHNGIVTTGGGSTIHLEDSHIQDANRAIDATSSHIEILGANTIFDKNIMHVVAKNSTVTVSEGKYIRSGNIAPPYSAGPPNCGAAFYLENCGVPSFLDIEEISNAEVGIYTRGSGILCQRNNIKDCRQGIFLWNSINTVLTTNKPCNIGGNSNGNNIRNCFEGIFAGGKLVPCNILDNTVISSGLFAIKTQQLRGRAMNISLNHITDSKIGIYSHLNSVNSFNNSGVNAPKTIFNNDITVNTQMIPGNNFDFKGIMVDELDMSTINNLPTTGTNAPNNNLQIAGNTVIDCRRGIYLMCCNSPYIAKNMVYVNTDMTDCFTAGSPTPTQIDFNTGIEVSACYNAKIQGNEVASIEPATGTPDWLTTGIRVAASPGSIVCDNITSPSDDMYTSNPFHPLYNSMPLQIGTGFEFYGVCFPTVFKENLMDNIKSRGLYMAGMDFSTGANGVIIGPQIDFSLASLNPLTFSFNSRDNTWNGMNQSTGIRNTDYNNVVGSYNRFYMTYPTSHTPAWPTDFLNSSAAGGVLNSPIYTFQSSVLSNTTLPCSNLRSISMTRDAYDDIALDSILKLGGNDTSRYFGKEFLYSQIKQNDTLSLDSTLAIFKANNDYTNMRYIDEIKEALIFPLDSIAIDSLQAKFEMIEPENNVEENYKTIYEMILKNPEMRDSVYIPREIAKLESIAQLCPFTDGHAVYMARVILHSFNPIKEYYNYCEFAKSPFRETSDRHDDSDQFVIKENPINTQIINGNYKIIPNPNNGIFSLICPDNLNILIKVFDSKGSKVYEELAIPNQKALYVDLSNSPQGIYNMLISSGNNNLNIKFAITK